MYSQGDDSYQRRSQDDRLLMIIRRARVQIDIRATVPLVSVHDIAATLQGTTFFADER